ncbi:hypothetical protein TNCV_2768571 [Trichonephila clavipes]|nr:hypothetical protein TNCV_2768571 [Trichonephila clavipes]
MYGKCFHAFFSDCFSFGNGDRGGLAVKLMVSWPACHEFEPSTAEDPLYTGGRCTLNMSRLKRSPVGVLWKFGEEVPAEVLLDHGSKLRGPSP